MASQGIISQKSKETIEKKVLTAIDEVFHDICCGDEIDPRYYSCDVGEECEIAAGYIPETMTF